MRLQLLLTTGILLGMLNQATAANHIIKAGYPNPVIPTETAAAALKFVNTPTPVPPTFTSTAIPTHTSTPTPTPTPVPAVTVWPSLSKGGQSILFKALSDPGTALQLSIQNQAGKVVFSTPFSRKSRSGGYVWRLQDHSGSPVPGGVYGYVLRFKQQGQEVTAAGNVTVFR